MLRILIRRLAEVALFLMAISFVSFLFIRVAPGDPVLSMLKIDELSVSKDQIEEMREELGFNDPLPIQYGAWLLKMATLNFGHSYMTGQPVMELIVGNLPATLELTAGSLVVMLLVAVPLGSLSAIYRNGWLDRASRVLAAAGAAVPSFWLGLILIELFAVRLSWMPAMGRGGLSSLLLPSLTLGLALGSVYIRLLRSSLLDSYSQEFIAAARARGLSEYTIFRSYALRHSLPPVVAMLGVSLGSLFGGVVVIEILFAYPGVGKLVVDSIRQRDYPVIQGYILVMAVIVFCINAGADIISRYLNPESVLKVKEKTT